MSNGIWSVGGTAPNPGAVNNGRGGLTWSGSNAPMFCTSFPPSRPKVEEDVEKHEARLAVALGIDCTSKVLGCEHTSPSPKAGSAKINQHTIRGRSKTYWDGSQWTKEEHPVRPTASKSRDEPRVLPVAPFKVLDAPNLRDDYYCSLLAFSPVCQTLAVGLGARLYSWSETMSVQTLEDHGYHDVSWLTSVDFSSNQGRKCILAYARSNGLISLMSLWDAPTLFDKQYPRFRWRNQEEGWPVACVS